MMLHQKISSTRQSLSLSRTGEPNYPKPPRTIAYLRKILPSKLGQLASRTQAMTIIEVAVASTILAMVLGGVLQAMLQSRRMTEGSVRQASISSLVQGYLEQIKNTPYSTDVTNALISSPTAVPGTGTLIDWRGSLGPPVIPNYTVAVYDSSQTLIRLCLAVGNAPSSLPAIGSLPTDASMHTEQVDIDNINSNTDNSTLNMWVWVNDLTGAHVVNCKSIVIVYQWTAKDGGQIHYYSDMMRMVRSVVPTD